MTTVEYRLDGDPTGPALVLTNSLGATTAMWERQVAALGAHFRLIRINTRGHGGSPAPAGPYSIADLGRDVLAVLDKLAVPRASYCGLSLGGMVGMWLAAHAPERIDRLALCCTSAHLPPARDWLDRAATVRARGVESIVDTVLRRWFTPAFHAARPAEIAAFRQMFVGTSAEGYAGCCAAIAELDLRPVLPRIGAPTLVIAGEQDPATPPEHGAVIAAGIPGARLMGVPGAHLAVVESAELVTPALLAHLTGRA